MIVFKTSQNHHNRKTRDLKEYRIISHKIYYGTQL